jgi:hypothetical protein
MTDHETAIKTHLYNNWSGSYTKPTTFTIDKIPGVYHDCVKVWRMTQDETDKTPGFIRLHETYWIFVSGRTVDSGYSVRTLLKTYAFPKPDPNIQCDYLGFFNNFHEYQLTFDFSYSEAR